MLKGQESEDRGETRGMIELLVGEKYQPLYWQSACFRVAVHQLAAMLPLMVNGIAAEAERAKTEQERAVAAAAFAVAPVFVDVKVVNRGGPPDDIEVGDRYGQVKCWSNTCATYRVGDEVPDTFDSVTYSLAMREGGFVNVKDRQLASWTDAPRFEPVFDKWGGLTEFAEGLFGESYLFRKEEA